MFKLLRCLFFVASLVSASAFAAGQAYDQGAFEAIQKAGKPALVMVHADWCPTCKAQEPILLDLLGKPEYKAINALRVDFDKQKDALKKFNVSTQSTLVVFRDGKEVGRSTGDTKKEAIAALLNKAI
jgi:thioredoxin 1